MQSGTILDDIAIIGIGCRFPGGADSPGHFWELLCSGFDAITEVPKNRFDIDLFFDEDRGKPGKLYTRWGGFVENLDGFDAEFFGISPREALHMDPQQRMLLEVVWEGLEEAGLDVELLAGTKTGVFIGLSGHDYSDILLNPDYRHLIDAYSATGSVASIAANRISYILDFRGPSLAVDTACSSSLTSVHLACQSLRVGECDLAIAGGANVYLNPETTAGFCKASMLSPSGKCKTFDASADGFVRGEGAGVIVLKPLSQAVKDGDPIFAVIVATAINQDGHTTGITVPSEEAQQAMLWQVLQQARIPASAVQYVETHGTGTPVGDPIEARAIGKVFSTGRAPNDACLIGSVKTNIGHLEAASGIAGLIKTALALRNRQIPQHLNLQKVNPSIHLDELRLRIPTTLEPWPASSGPAIAGVNAFGFGGANAHALLQEPPRRKLVTDDPGIDSAEILTISARSAAALSQGAGDFASFLQERQSIPLNDVCFSSAERRTHHEHRLAVVAKHREEFVDCLEAYQAGERRAGVLAGHCLRDEQPRVAFVFSGMGPQWWGMGRQLIKEMPVFRQSLEQCDRPLRKIAGWSIIEELSSVESRSRLAEVEVAQVANFALQVALAEVWRSWGIVPDAVLGHSAGEIAASYVAGALSFEEALATAVHRGRLQARFSGQGTMLAANLSYESARALAGDGVSVAAVNSPNSVTFSGKPDGLKRIAAHLEQREIFSRFLPVTVPYHSPQMDPIREELIARLENLRPQSAAIRLLSTINGSWADGRELGADYWWRSVREPVLFGSVVDLLISEGYNIFVEVGPHPVLAGAVSECLAHRNVEGMVLPTLRRLEDEREVMLRSLAALHTRGRRICWEKVFSRGGNCVSLPRYPWQRERFWFEPAAEPSVIPRQTALPPCHPLLGSRLRSARPSWEADLGDARLKYLEDHALQGEVVFPAAAYIEMALAAAGEIWPGTSVCIESIDFRKALFLSDRAATSVQLHYDPGRSSFEIYSSEREIDSAWKLHASGQIGSRSAAESLPPVDLKEIGRRCVLRIPVAECYQMLERHGLQYRGAFRAIQELQQGEGEALAVIAFPTGINVPDAPYQVTPALLDAAFQVLIGTAGARDLPEAALVLPVSVKQLHFYSSPGERFWAHVSVIHSGNDAVEADICLLDQTGKIALRISGFRCQVVREDRTAARAIDNCLYEPRWTRKDLPLAHAAEIRSSLEVCATLAPVVHEFADEWYRVITKAEPKLNAVACHFIANALRDVGWAGRDVRAETLGIAPVHHRFFARLVEIVRASGAAEWGSEVLPHRLAEDLVAEHPECCAPVEMLRRNGEHLASILRGEVDPQQLLFSADAFPSWNRFFEEFPGYRLANKVAGELIALTTSGLPTGAKLRIAEIGAGTGSTTSAVISRLEPGSVDYLFSDISPVFLTRAKERFTGYACLRYEVLDIERPSRALERQFDIVLAANVLHATVDLRVTLRNVQRLLAPGGLLVLLEATRKEAWLDLLFGVTKGWWRFADVDLRPSHPLLSQQRWKALLAEVGFELPAAISGWEDRAEPLESILLAHAPAPEPVVKTASRQWLVFMDRQGVGMRVASSLRARGHRCTLVQHGAAYRQSDGENFEICAGDRLEMCRLLEQLQVAGMAPDGVIHFWSLDAPKPGDMTTSQFMDSQKVTCASALYLIRALAKSARTFPEIWFVTAGSQQVEEESEALNVAQAPIWGLGQVLSNEQGNVCRLVDLGPTCSADEIEGLINEICRIAPEAGIAFRGSGRFVKRLLRLSPASAIAPSPRRAVATDTGSFRVEGGTPGMLETLHLREMPAPKAGPGEVVIRVKAAGLNFRDVMMALGMLPPLDSDPLNLARGPECAGTIVECGEGVAEFSRGDDVVAIAPGSFASRVKTASALVAAKPSHLTFEEAATIPTAFLTAHYALRSLAQLAPGERVLIHAGTGAVGLAAIQIAKRIGAEIFATAGSDEKRAYLRSLQIEQVMDSRSLAFADEILEATNGEGVDVVLNSIAGEAIAKGLSLLRTSGRFVEIGKRDIAQDTQLGLSPFRKNLSFFGLALDRLWEERPQFIGALLREIVREISAKTLAVIPQTIFDMSETEQAFRFMAQAKHIGKVVISTGKDEYLVNPRDNEPIFRSDATYLITGGLGGLGLTVANWMVAQGAANIVLMSRTGIPGEDSKVALQDLLESSANVVLFKGDVSRPEDVTRLLTEVQQNMPPLRGIMHLAMLLDDAWLEHLDYERFCIAMAPKAAGAWNLHTLTLGQELDFFVLFSSVASILGPPGQGNYAAANAFLDALAQYRRTIGLPALAINWGMVSKVGIVSRRAYIGEYVARLGFQDFAPDEALAILEKLLRREVSNVIAVRTDWQRWKTSDRAAHVRHSFFDPPTLEEQKTLPAEDPQANFLTALANQSLEERATTVAAHLVERVAKVLGASPSRIDATRSLTEIGLDSLMAVELQTIIARKFGVALAVSKLLEGASIRQLANDILLHLSFGTEVAAGPVSAQAGAAKYPLSFEQERFWFLDRLEPGNPAFNLPVAIRVSGTLDLSALEASLSEVVRRHDSLRSTFHEKDGRPPVQDTAPAFDFTLSVRDLRNGSRAEREAEVMRICTDLAQTRFDLSRGPLLRATVLRLEPEEHVVLTVIHHIVVDAWSYGLMLAEVSQLYEAFTSERASPLPDLKLQYKDFVLRQEAPAQSDQSYWREQLAGASPLLNLPTDHSRPALKNFRGGHHYFAFSQKLSQSLQELSRREGVTMFMTLLAGFTVLLNRYTGQEDISIGTPVGSRNRIEFEQVIGCFVDTLVMREDVTGEPSFLELLHRTRRTALEAYAHQIPLTQVVQAVQPERDASRTPLFQVLFVFHNVPMPPLHIEGLQLTQLNIESGTAAFDLMLVIEPGEQLHGSLEYNADLFEPATTARMLQHLENLLEAIVEDPEQHTSLIPILADDDRREILAQSIGALPHYGINKIIHELFEAQAEKTPDAVAVVFGDECLTYRELNSHSSQLARYLQSLGVEPDAPVGICMERSLDLVVGLLGILKAGGAFVPLDPEYPKQRLALIADDVRTTAVLTKQQWAEIVAAKWGRVVCLDRDWTSITAENAENLPNRVTAANLAYIIYTSGSTGEPKGVMVPHHAICNQLLWRLSFSPLTESDAVLQKTPFSFDPSVWEFFAPLLVGARLILAKPGGHQDSAYLVELIRKNRITAIQFVPSTLEAFLDEQGVEDLDCLKHVYCGGEALSLELQARFFSRLNAKLHNLYGPTETTIDATFWTCRREVDRRVVPIGRPIANAEVYVLDARLRPVPVGVPGELHIGGAGLARGYLNQPKLTAEMFIANPFGVPGARLYKTGDLARLLPDGSIEFLGRVDRQIKLRGFRIEPGEIETLLAGFPGLRQSVVLAREDNSSLVAYVVPAPGQTLDIDGLRQFVAGRLPTYMHPGSYVLLDDLPLDPNGKIDRRVLPVPRRSGVPERSFVAPRDDLELQLASIWESVLDVRPVGVTDNFFDLGGHSLLAARAATQIRRVLSQEFSLSNLFQSQTIESLAQFMRNGPGASSGRSRFEYADANGKLSPSPS